MTAEPSASVERSRPPAPRRLPGWPAVLAVLAVLSVALSIFVVTPEIWLDDPFIGYRYAHNLEAGHGLVFNPGDRLEGYTAFLWVYLAYVAIHFGVEPLSFLQFLSVAAQILTLPLLFALGHSPGRSPWRSLLAPALMSVHVAFVTWSMMGMSASFIAMLVTAATLILQRRGLDRPAMAWLLGAVCLTIALTRFDGVVLVALLLGFALLFDRQVKRLLPPLALLGVGLAVFNAWRIGFYGDLLPNTFHAKQSDLGGQLAAGFRYLAGFAIRGGPYALLLVTVPLTARRASRAMRISAWVALGHLVYVLAVGGDWMVHYRFILPVLPLLGFLLQESLWLTADRVVESGLLPSRAAPRALAVAVALVLLANLAPLATSRWASGEAHRPGPYWSAVEARAIGRHLDRILPPDALVATEWAGIIPYHMRQPVLDIFGLNDREITAGDFPGSRMGRGITADYLVDRAPDVVVVCARIFPTVEEARRGIDSRPPGTWVKGFYASLREPRYGYELCVSEVEGEGYFPFLVRGDYPSRGSLCLP